MFGFTRQERSALIFLSAVLSFGLFLDFFSRRIPRLKSWVSVEENFARPGLNSSGKEELASLPGIGEKLALRIIDYRNEKGPFSCVEELKRVKGISEAKYLKLKDSLSLR